MKKILLVALSTVFFACSEDSSAVAPTHENLPDSPSPSVSSSSEVPESPIVSSSSDVGYSSSEISLYDVCELTAAEIISSTGISTYSEFCPLYYEVLLNAIQMTNADAMYCIQLAECQEYYNPITNSSSSATEEFDLVQMPCGTIKCDNVSCRSCVMNVQSQAAAMGMAHSSDACNKARNECCATDACRYGR